MKITKRFWRDRSGATLVEYGVIIGVLTLMILAGLGNAYNAVQRLFEDDTNRLIQSIQ